MHLFERDLKHIPYLDAILPCFNQIQNEHDISEQAIFEEIFSNKSNEEEKVTIPYSLSIREEESNININPLNDKYYPIEKIIKILEENNIPKYIIDIIRLKDISYKDIENISNQKKKFMTQKKRKKKSVFIINLEDLTCGWNKKNDNTVRKHNKDSTDNIIRKIKVCIFKKLIEYSKEHISKKLLSLDYNKYISNLKKDINLQMLDSPLREILSLDTSVKYGKDKKEHNKKTINSIIKESNNEKVKNLLEMKLNDWINNIFLFKGNSENETKYKGLESTLLYIIKNLEYPNDKDYLKRFVFYLYNFSNWFRNKKGRNENNLIK